MSVIKKTHEYIFLMTTASSPWFDHSTA